MYRLHKFNEDGSAKNVQVRLGNTDKDGKWTEVTKYDSIMHEYVSKR